MATKKKAVVKKAVAKKAKKKTAAAAPVQVIFIQLDGSPFPPSVDLDANGKKHPPKVFWQAINPMQQYQIVLDDPPKPFKNGSGPFPTSVTGATQTLSVEKKYANGQYQYWVEEVKGRNKLRVSGGGIIIDA